MPMPLPGGSDMRVNTTVLANIVRVPSPNAYFASAYISGKDSVHAQLLSSTVICIESNESARLADQADATTYLQPIQRELQAHLKKQKQDS